MKLLPLLTILTIVSFFKSFCQQRFEMVKGPQIPQDLGVIKYIEGNGECYESLAYFERKTGFSKTIKTINGEVQIEEVENNLLLKDGQIYQLGKNERPIHYSCDKLFTSQPSNLGDRDIITSYKIAQDSISQTNRVDFENVEGGILVTSDGEIVEINGGEWGGYDFKFYNSNHQLIETYLPFEEDHDSSQLYSYNGKILIATNPKSGSDQRPRIALFNSKNGDLLFETSSKNNGYKIFKVKIFKELIGVFQYNRHLNDLRLQFFNYSGSMISDISIDDSPVDFYIVESSSPRVFMWGRKSITAYNPLNGNKLSILEFNRISSSVSNSDKISVLDFKLLENGQAGLVLGEYLRADRSYNTSLAILNGDLDISTLSVTNVGLTSSEIKILSNQVNKIILTNESNLLHHEIRN